MTNAYYNVQPFLILNLGGEMVYILDQRLRSQDIANERAQKVLQDIINSMLSARFIQELFRPQAMYTMVSTRQIFEKLAHSSIMKLNTTSMQKLFDLMLMGMKYQTQQICQPEEIYHNTMRHLLTMQELIKGSTTEQNVVATMKSLETMCADYKAYDYQIIRQQMYKFFEDRHIKVSLFIQDKIQGLDGTIYIDFCGVGPKFSQKPGQVIFFNPENGSQARKKMINMMHSDKWQPYPFPTRNAQTTRPHLGTNMYAADREKPPIPWKPNSQEDAELERIRIQKAKVAEEMAKNNANEEEKLESNEATDEFNLLAELICAP